MKTVFAVLAAAGAASAAADRYFGGVAIHSGTDGAAVHNQGISASSSSLWIGHAQNASCNPKQDFATFSVAEDKSVYLYTDGAPYQQLYVDRSGMGRGVMGYTTGAQPAPKNAERTGFAVNADGHLQFDGNDFWACPSVDNSYGVYASKFDDKCISFAWRAQYTETDKAVPCSYSE